MKQRPGLFCQANLAARNMCSGRKNWAFIKVSITLWFLSPHSGLHFHGFLKLLFQSYKYQLTVVYIFLEGNELNIAFHLFQCHKIRFRETSYILVHHGIRNTFTVLGEQTLTIFDDVLLEKTVHVQLGHHTRKSQKAWKNNVWSHCSHPL